MRLVGRAMRRKRADLARANPTPILRGKEKILRRRKPKIHGELYALPAWKELRAIQLANTPICEACCRRPATEVDHQEKHRGDLDKFLDPSNLVSVCRRCHAQKTAWERHPRARFPDPSRPRPQLRPARTRKGI